jgi:hypothetical protein
MQDQKLSAVLRKSREIGSAFIACLREREEFACELPSSRSVKGQEIKVAAIRKKVLQYASGHYGIERVQ